jgi:hypothetical protein
MAGGIQPGTEAGSKESKQLDGDVRIIAQAIAQAQNTYYYEQGHRNLTSNRVRENKRDSAALPELVKKGITLGCVPDGGMWFDGDRTKVDRILKVVFEAKHQQDGGNAIERWGTNHDICKFINPEVVYVTFATGEGAREGGVLYRHGTNMHIIHGDRVQWIYSPAGFSQETIFNIMNDRLGLDLTFEKIKPFLNRKINTFDEFFHVETEEERLARVAESTARNKAEQDLSRFIQDTKDPLYLVWHKLPRTDLEEAHEIVIEMLQQGEANANIASTLVECFLD